MITNENFLALLNRLEFKNDDKKYKKLLTLMLLKWILKMKKSPIQLI